MVEAFFGGLGKIISRHLGGGVLWLYAAGFGIILFMGGYIKFLEARLDDVKTQRDNAIAESNAKGAVVNSQGRTQARRTEAANDLQNIETAISGAPSPLDYTYSWLRDKRKSEADNTPN